MHSLICFSVVSFLFGLANSQTISIGKCPNVPVKTDFDLNKVTYIIFKILYIYVHTNAEIFQIHIN